MSDFNSPNMSKKVLTLLLLLSAFYYLWTEHCDQQNDDDRLKILNENITRHLLDSIYVGLAKFHKEIGHYPEIEGKYFFDSIKYYIRIDDTYVYADTMDSKYNVRQIRKPVGKRFNYIIHDSTYIAIGIKELVILYKFLPPDSFLLYSVGNNLKDEFGNGDDIRFIFSDSFSKK